MSKYLGVLLCLMSTIAIHTPAHALRQNLLTHVSYSYEIALYFSGTGLNETISDSSVGEGPRAGYHYDGPYSHNGVQYASQKIEAEVLPYRARAFSTHLNVDASELTSSGEWTFIPNYDNVAIDLGGYAATCVDCSGGGLAEYAYRLFDYTDNRRIIDQRGLIDSAAVSPTDDWFLSSQRQYRLMAHHRYGLKLVAHTDVLEFGMANAYARFSIPEPATMLLLGSGLFGLVACKRRRLNNG